VSWSWYIYTAKPASDVIAFDGDLSAALDAFLEERDIDDEMAEPGPGGPAPPKPDEVSAYRARFRETVEQSVLERLATCRSTYAFDYVRGGLQASPLQVSVMKYALDALAPCVVDWGDMSLELGERALGRIAKMRSRGNLRPSAPVAKKKPVKLRAEKPGEVRAARIFLAIKTASRDPDATFDLRQAIAKLSPDANRYLAMLVEEGAMPDARARKELGMDAAQLIAVMDEIESALRTS